MTTERRDLEILTEIRQLNQRLLKGTDLFNSLLQDADSKLATYQSGIQTDFSAWLRGNPQLDSRAHGLSIHDVDWIVHQYRVSEDKNGPRRFGNLMLIEEKRFSKEPSFAQSDTLAVIDQCLRGGNGRHKVTDSSGRKIWARYYGLHLLQFSGSGPLDSERIAWDKRPIDVLTLEQIIRFEVHPESLLPMDTTGRRHHANQAADTPLFPHEGNGR